MISFSKLLKINQKENENKELPVIPLRDNVVFPGIKTPLFVGRKKTAEGISAALENDRMVFLAFQENPEESSPDIDSLSKEGVVGKILQLLKLPDDTIKVLIQGEFRAYAADMYEHEGYMNAFVSPVEDIFPEEVEFEAVKRQIISAAEEYHKVNSKKFTKDHIKHVSEIDDAGLFSDTIASKIGMPFQEKQTLVKEPDISKRLNEILLFILKEIEVTRVEAKIKDRIKKQIEETQKNYYLNEQMRAIKKEMGSPEDEVDELEELKKKIEEKRLPEEAHEKTMKEFNKLKRMSPMSAEATVVRNYIDWILDVPWTKISEVDSDLKDAEAILEADHYGLKDPKERILEYLAVQSLVEKVKGPILCFVGPPGVGKTSLARSIAKATGREYIRLSLGGVRDEAEIRGHRRTYIGAMPGKIIQSMKKAGTINPLICLDEVDKMSMDFRGDPSSALLEVLDPEQNFSFNDHYLDMDYDLSSVFFLTTANSLADIPPALRDRMEIIEISGYTELEKLQIARNHLMVKQIDMNGLKDEDIVIDDDVLLFLIRHYTREAGVRGLERQISAICRKVAKALKLENAESPFYITSEKLKDFFGPEKFTYSLTEQDDLVGVATGLAWTQAGGDILSIETAVMPGKGNVIVTGKLGDVMQESAKAAMSYARSISDAIGIDTKFYETKDIHIHVPEGATPKDGPSAGITICTSIISALSGKAVDRYLGMTGEITLRGRVLPIGGLREKTIAAHRSGLKKILFPKENEKDLRDVPESIKDNLTLIPVAHMDEVLNYAFGLETKK